MRTVLALVRRWPATAALTTVAVGAGAHILVFGGSVDRVLVVAVGVLHVPGLVRVWRGS